MQWTLHSNDKSLTTGYAGKKASPAAMSAAVAVHIGAVIAFLLMPANKYIPNIDIGLTAHPVPLPDDPPIEKAHPKKTKAQPKTKHQDSDVPKSDPGFPPVGPFTGSETKLDPFEGGGTTIIDPPHVPVWMDAQIDPSHMRDFQPEYPAAMQRLQQEGDVTVRVHINAQGRVDAIELVKANNDAFWNVTRRQALAHWRFRPATRDGEAVETTRVMTVHFRLSDT